LKPAEEGVLGQKTNWKIDLIKHIPKSDVGKNPVSGMNAD